MAVVDGAIETLKTAYEYNPLQLIVQEFERFKAEPPQPEHSILGTRVEKDYCFPEATEIDGELSLYQTLQTLSGEAIHLICILYQSRANQPYDRFMERYRTYARCFPFIFSSLDVIAGDSENVGWLENEQQAIAQNLRLRVIIEPDNSVAEYFDVESIPAVFGVDKRARVVLDNQLYDEVALWKWLNQYAALRSKIDG